MNLWKFIHFFEYLDVSLKLSREGIKCKKKKISLTDADEFVDVQLA